MRTPGELEALLAIANERIKQLEQRLLSSEAEKGENLPQFCQSTMKESHGVCLMPTNSCQQCKWTDTPSPPSPQEKQGVEEYTPLTPLGEQEREELRVALISEYSKTTHDTLPFEGQMFSDFLIDKLFQLKLNKMETTNKIDYLKTFVDCNRPRNAAEAEVFDAQLHRAINQEIQRVANGCSIKADEPERREE